MAAAASILAFGDPREWVKFGPETIVDQIVGRDIWVGSPELLPAADRYDENGDGAFLARLRGPTFAMVKDGDLVAVEARHVALRGSDYPEPVYIVGRIAEVRTLKEFPSSVLNYEVRLVEDDGAIAYIGSVFEPPGEGRVIWALATVVATGKTRGPDGRTRDAAYLVSTETEEGIKSRPSGLPGSDRLRRAVLRAERENNLKTGS